MSSCDRLRFGTIKPGFSSGGSEGAEVSSFSADAAGAPPVTEAWPPSNAKVAALHLDGAAAHASEGTAAIAEDRLKDPAFQLTRSCASASSWRPYRLWLGRFARVAALLDMPDNWLGGNATTGLAAT
jgi:hypothetical protein